MPRRKTRAISGAATTRPQRRRRRRAGPATSAILTIRRMSAIPPMARARDIHRSQAGIGAQVKRLDRMVNSAISSKKPPAPPGCSQRLTSTVSPKLSTAPRTIARQVDHRSARDRADLGRAQARSRSRRTRPDAPRSGATRSSGPEARFPQRPHQSASAGGVAPRRLGSPAPPVCERAGHHDHLEFVRQPAVDGDLRQGDQRDRVQPQPDGAAGAPRLPEHREEEGDEEAQAPDSRLSTAPSTAGPACRWPGCPPARSRITGCGSP